MRHFFIGNKNAANQKLIREYRININGVFRRVTEQMQILETDRKGNIWLTFSMMDISPDQSPPIGAISDSLGQFVISNIPVGRHEIQVSYVGYEPVIVKDILATSSKEVFLEIQMKENTTQLGEIIVKPKIKKSEPFCRSYDFWWRRAYCIE